MKKFPIFLLLALGFAAGLLSSCSDDDDNSAYGSYTEWRETNIAWMMEQQARKNPDGSKYYDLVVPAWDPSGYVLIHYFNDRSLTEGNLSPLLTSTVDVRYKGYLSNDVAFDSSSLNTTYGPGIFRTKLNEVITGWAIAFETMHVGDTAEIIIPYQQAYGTSVTSAIPPYSNLRFNVRLVNIHAYEKE